MPVGSDKTAAGIGTEILPELNKLIEQYDCGPVRIAGTGDALYERHLTFDNVVEAASVGARERYEGIARSVRDILSQRWLRTEHTYKDANPKRVYVFRWTK